jgi:hypothetical protein
MDPHNGHKKGAFFVLIVNLNMLPRIRTCWIADVENCRLPWLTVEVAECTVTHDELVVGHVQRLNLFRGWVPGDSILLNNNINQMWNTVLTTTKEPLCSLLRDL